MNEIKKFKPINELSLNQSLYFQALFQEACIQGIFSQVQIERIQLEIIELLGKEIERYTNGESSSVPVEKAQEILQSITYCMGLYLKSIPDMEEKLELLQNQKISELFYKGMDTAAGLKNEASQLLINLQNNRLKIENIAYQDTILEGIPPFFHDYNIEYAAQDIPGSVDYPLLRPETELLGVESAYDYIYHLSIENSFFMLFPTENINLLLKGFDKEAEHMLINIFELVLTNVLGCELLGIELTKLNITSAECSWLKKYFHHLSIQEVKEKLEKAFERVSIELNLKNDIISYARFLMEPLAIRINSNLQTDTLSKIFISFHNREEEEGDIFEDGISMEDDKLREFIEELSGRKTVAEKLTLIREKINSLRDFIELLNECFYGEEYVEVFHMLQDTEKSIIWKYIREDVGLEDWKDYHPEKEWQKIFLEMSL